MKRKSPLQEAEAVPAQETLASRGQERGHREEADGGEEEGLGHSDERRPRPQHRGTRSQVIVNCHRVRSVLYLGFTDPI